MISRKQIAVYVGRRFVLAFCAIMGVLILLLFFIEMLENLRRIGSNEAPLWVGLLVTGLRLPWLSEQMLPFAVLFASMATFMMLSRSNELIVIRAAGVSVWQFLMPVMLSALALGLLASLAYNPLAAHMLERHQVVFAEWFGTAPQTQTAWLRQSGPEGSSVFYAGSAATSGDALTVVTAYLYDQDNVFLQRIEAERAFLERGVWRLEDAVILESGAEPRRVAEIEVGTLLTAAQVRENLTSAETIGFWQLPNYIDIAQRSGLNARPLQMEFHSLLAQPLLFIAMALIAGTFSLRLFRYGNIGRMILAGIGSGFLLYVALNLMRDLGTVGLVPTVLAAWIPGFVALIVGSTLLLFQEDG
ncbi:MAG: LPS export ABC transporter permease LptG [Pseudomonadota bacterium]